MKKGIKYTVWAVIVLALAFNSIYFKKLSEVKASDKKFDAVAYAKGLYAKLPSVTDKAITLDQLVNEVNADKAKAFSDYGHALAIGSTRFFMVKGSGVVKEINESDVLLTTAGGNDVSIATEFVFGNAVRDASGQVNLNDFSNTVDLSNISSEVDKIIRAQVLPAFKAAVKKGDKVDFTGAIELNQEHLNLGEVELMPVSLNITPQVASK
ncbi:putative lipoprotein DUF2291 [Mucilaginibacter yixingensis]|uniref:Putative lipoprotein DUF2291 n=1 Tax=Mucilaginibacter yixingensis TaxID=1295612 RepID=A0A2T5JF81_9SPHI|nr:DUF2291 domain-containing protein [Mucilaginibacter yixingensis]PTR01093.1 putative lipoprotein DUF2291 [Mucilaginibacter yixingensis]